MTTTTAPRIYGHRGAPQELPENTMESFARAIACGVTHLESDVHMTSDGAIVLSHDPSGERMAGVAQEIRRTTLREVRTWDVGAGFVDANGDRPFADRGMRVPLLHELLDAYPDVPLNLDMKQTTPSLVEPLVRLLDDRRAAERVLLASFAEENLTAARGLGYRGAFALGRRQILGVLTLPLVVARARRPAGELRAQVPVRAGGLVLGGPRFISRCRALDIGVDFWTINAPDEARALVALGADGIMTDDPARLVPALRA